MPKCIAALLFLASFAANVVASETAITRYGTVSATAPTAPSKSISVRFNGRTVVNVDADQVTLHKVRTAPGAEYVVVEAWRPALHCHHHYVLLKIAKSGRTRHSPAFGSCYELRSVRHSGSRVQVKLTSAAGPPRNETFIWAGAKLRRFADKGNGR